MGWFSQSKSVGESKRADIERWRSVYCERNGAVQPIGDQLLVRVAEKLGVSTQDIDQVVALTSIYNLFRGLAGYLGDAGGERGLDEEILSVIQTRGFDDDAIWNVLFARRATGVVIAETIVTDHFPSDSFLQPLAEAIREQGGVGDFVQLHDPSTGEGAPEQVLFDLMSGLGLYYLVFGVGCIQELADAVASAAPTIMMDDQGSYIGGSGALRWGAWSSAGGSVLAIFPLANAGDDPTELIALVDRLERLAPTWKVQAGKVGAFVPRECASIINDGKPVLPIYLDAVLSEPYRSQRRMLRDFLLSYSFEQITPGLLKGVLPGTDGRTQLMWFHFGRELEILSPIAQTTTQEIPPPLTVHDFGRYNIDLFPPFVVLKITVDYAMGVEYIRDEALVLGQYADQCEAWWSGEDLL